MFDFNISKTLSIMMRTMPFILMRMVIYFGITIAYIVVTGAGAGIGYGVGNVSSDPSSFAIWGGVVGFGIVSAVVYWVREYILYVVKAGHIAVMVQLIDGKPIPGGKGQIDYAAAEVKKRFAQTSALFAVDQLLKGIIRALTGVIFTISAFIPIPGLEGIAKFVNSIIRISLTYVDEVILGYAIRTDSQDAWQSARHGVVLYAQNGKTMIKNAIWLAVFMYVIAFVIFLLMLAPAAGILYLYPGSFAGWSFVLAIVLAWAFKAAFIEPFAIAALMSVYFETIEGQAPDPAWDQKLEDVSGRFRELKERAMQGFRPQAPEGAAAVQE